eukprot:6822273-Alexandrium_andersonii.AAC.1
MAARPRRQFSPVGLAAVPGFCVGAPSPEKCTRASMTVCVWCVKGCSSVAVKRHQIRQSQLDQPSSCWSHAAMSSQSGFGQFSATWSQPA